MNPIEEIKKLQEKVEKLETKFNQQLGIIIFAFTSAITILFMIK